MPKTSSFSSLSEVLAHIKGKSPAQAMLDVNAEYAIVSSQIEWLRRAYKRQASRINPALVDYFSGLQKLLHALDPKTRHEFLLLPDGYTKQQIESGLKHLSRTESNGLPTTR